MSGVPSAVAAAPKRIGVFGGSFNPPHICHVLACQYALCAQPLDMVIVVPNFQHPFDKDLAPFAHRFWMTRIAFEHLAPFVEISRIEEELGGVSYTIDTVRALRQQNCWAEYHLVVGSDILDEIARWKEYEALVREAPLVVVPRLAPGDKPAPGQFGLPAVSSSAIRDRLRLGEDPGGVLPQGVLTYIREHGLYRGTREQGGPN